MDAARDGAILEQLSFHLVDRSDQSSGRISVASAVDETVAIEPPLGEVGHGGANRLASAIVGAVLAHAVGLTIAVAGFIILAGFLGQTVLFHVVKHDAGVAAAAAGLATVQDNLAGSVGFMYHSSSSSLSSHLHRQNDIRALRFARDFDTIREGRGSANGPAAAAVPGWRHKYNAEKQCVC